jgi:hypothetical protein
MRNSCCVDAAPHVVSGHRKTLATSLKVVIRSDAKDSSKASTVERPALSLLFGRIAGKARLPLFAEWKFGVYFRAWPSDYANSLELRVLRRLLAGCYFRDWKDCITHEIALVVANIYYLSYQESPL